VTSAAPTILALETDSSWVVILVVSAVTLPAALILRRLIARPGGLASGLFLSLPLAIPLIAAMFFQHAVFPEISFLRPAVPSLFNRPGALLHVLLVPAGDSHHLTPYALVGSAGPWLLLIGVGVSAFMLIRRAVGAWLMHKLIRRCAPLEDDGVRTTVARLSMDAPLARPPDVLVLPEGMSGAFAVGGRRGRILVSPDLIVELDPDELEGILAHEVAHLQARDVHVVFTAGLLRDMVAWNPFAHLAYRRLLTDRELEADRRAAAITGRPLAVASGLLKVCEISRHRPRLKQRMALGFLRPGGRVARRVTNLIKISDNRGALSSHGAVGQLPYVAAACLLVVLGLQAGSRIAELGNGALGFMWGDSAETDVRTWRPADLPDKGLIRALKANHPKMTMTEVRTRGLARLREDVAVLPGIAVRQADINKYLRRIRHMATLAKHNGIPTADLDEQAWVRVPIIHGPVSVVGIRPEDI
jgi:Zn-dependent protease with chaperone function